MEINFRPHHFLCAFCFQGNGYSPPFIVNFNAIMAYLNAYPDTPITVVSHTDSICAPCPHRDGLTCETETSIAVLDKAHANALHLKPKDVLTWSTAKIKMAEKISLDTFHHICGTCSWKKLGICESVLTAR